MNDSLSIFENEMHEYETTETDELVLMPNSYKTLTSF